MRTYVIVFLSSLLILMACKIPVQYSAIFDKMNSTQVELELKKFKVLGTFTGEAIVKKTTNFNRAEGLLSKARLDLLKNAEKAGYPLKGNRTLINITIDYIESETALKAIITADMIQFD